MAGRKIIVNIPQYRVPGSVEDPTLVLTNQLLNDLPAGLEGLQGLGSVTPIAPNVDTALICYTLFNNQSAK